MSETTEEPQNGEGKKKSAPTDREKSKPEPVPKRKDFFEWIEQLFDGQQNFPEKLDVRSVSGKDFAVMGKPVTQKLYPPKIPKPTREDLVHLSNEILMRVQQDCDVRRKSTVYMVGAMHFSREDDFYERFLIRCNPQQTWKNGENGENEDDEEDSLEKRYSHQLINHSENLIGLVGSTMERFADRDDRLIERLQRENEDLRNKNNQLFDMIQRLLEATSDREERKMWADFKIRSAERGLGLAMDLAPPLINKLVGKQVIHTQKSTESITLENFFKTITKDQADRAFGIWDANNPEKCITEGVLTGEQGTILIQVAHCQRPADEIDKLIPGGECAISMEQFMALQQIFSMEQLAPLGLVFQSRQKKDQ